MTFAYVSGRPCLDLVGTLKWRRRLVPDEQFDAPARVAEWARGAQLLSRLGPVSVGDLERAIRVREAIYRTVTARLAGAGPFPRDRSLLNAAAAEQPVTTTLTTRGDIRRIGSCRQLLASVVLDAFDLLGGDQLALVRECEAPDCTRLFVDSSHGRSRRWCGMAECGNRAKVRAFRERQGAIGTGGRGTAGRSLAADATN